MHKRILSACLFVVAAAVTIWATKPKSMYYRIPTGFCDGEPTGWELKEAKMGTEEHGETMFPVWAAILTAGMLGYSVDIF